MSLGLRKYIPSLGPPAPVDADIAAVTDRVKLFEAKLVFGTDACTSTDFKVAVFSRLGHPTDIFFIIKVGLKLFEISNYAHKFIKKFL